MNLTPDELKSRFEAWATENGTYDLRPAKWRVTMVAGKPYDGYIRPYLCDRTVYAFQGFCGALGAPEAHSQDGYDFFADRLAKTWFEVPFDVMARGQEAKGSASGLAMLGQARANMLNQIIGGDQHPCWSCKKPVALLQRSEADGNCPHCGTELDLELWPQPKEST